MLEVTNTEKENSTNPIVSSIFQYGGHITSHIDNQEAIDFLDAKLSEINPKVCPVAGWHSPNHRFVKVVFKLPALGAFGLMSDLYGRDAGDEDFTNDRDDLIEVFRPFQDGVRENASLCIPKDKFPARPAFSVCFVGALEVGEDGRWNEKGICYTAMGHSSLNFPEKEPSDPNLTEEEKPISEAYWLVNKIRG